MANYTIWLHQWMPFGVFNQIKHIYMEQNKHWYIKINIFSEFYQYYLYKLYPAVSYYDTTVPACITGTVLISHFSWNNFEVSGHKPWKFYVKIYYVKSYLLSDL